MQRHYKLTPGYVIIQYFGIGLELYVVCSRQISLKFVLLSAPVATGLGETDKTLEVTEWLATRRTSALYFCKH